MREPYWNPWCFDPFASFVVMFAAAVYLGEVVLRMFPDDEGVDEDGNGTGLE